MCFELRCLAVCCFCASAQWLRARFASYIQFSSAHPLTLSLKSTSFGFRAGVQCATKQRLRQWQAKQVSRTHWRVSSRKPFEKSCSNRRTTSLVSWVFLSVTMSPVSCPLLACPVLVVLCGVVMLSRSHQSHSTGLRFLSFVLFFVVSNLRECNSVARRIVCISFGEECFAFGIA